MALGRALAMLGRGAEAIEVFDQMARTVEEQNVRRFAGRAENFRGWVLRNLGALHLAREATDQAWEAVQALDPVAGAEARGHAILDLADDALRRADLVRAEQWLDLARQAELAPHVMKWRFDIRRDLLLGRFALDAGDPAGAAGWAEQVRLAADAVGVRRFAVQADLLKARADHRSGVGLDLDAVAAAAGALAEVAPLESWWLLGELARELDQPRFLAAAEQRVELLLPGAGAWADDLRRAAGQLLA
jgi:hypothetical protein